MSELRENSDVVAIIDTTGVDDTDVRKRLTIVDTIIGTTKLKYLILLARPLFGTNSADIRDASCVLDIYNLLIPHYGGNYEKAASEIYELLGILNIDGFSSSKSSDIWQIKEFSWLMKLIELYNKALTQGIKEDELVRHLFEEFKICNVNRDAYTSSAALLWYMIDSEIVEQGSEKDLNAIQKAFSNDYHNICKYKFLPKLYMLLKC